MNFNALVSDKEVIYFSIMLVISIIIYFVLTITVIGIVYVLEFALFLWIAQGVAIGALKRNAVKLSDKQFSEIYNKIKEYSSKLELEKVPDVYLMQSDGLLNAFATRFCFRDFIVLYSDVMELAYEQGEDAVNFIVAHELAHVKRKHLVKSKWILFGNIVPFLGWAYSRACEITCDNIALALVPEAKVEGMLLLMAGKKLYKNVDLDALIETQKKDNDFWTWCAEICSTHPNLLNRILNLKPRIFTVED